MAKGIYKRDKYYWIRYAGLDGRVVYESSKSDKFKDAEALLMERKQAIREGRQPEKKRIENHTFKELAEEYLSWIHGRQKSEEVKHYIIGRMLNALGNIPLRKFSTAFVEQFQTGLLNRGLRNSTINKALSVIKHMFSKAVDWEFVESETLKQVRRVKLLPDDSKRLRYLSREECERLIAACDLHIKPLVITALNTGMRKSEIFNLKWDNVDLRHGFILLDTTKNGERREIPINQTLKETLQGITRRLDVPYVFFNPSTNKPYTKDLKRSFHTALKKAGIRDFHFHDLRHTFASHLVMAGVDITTVRELLGHKTLTMTLRYAHLAPSHKVKAMGILDETLNKKSIGGGSTIQKLYNFEGEDFSETANPLIFMVGTGGLEPPTSTVSR